MTDVVMSIKPVHLKRIVTGVKNYEFRKYIPKKGVNRLWIYTSSPECRLEYMAVIDKIVTYPDKITEEGLGNAEFNNGGKKAIHAYHISKLYKLKEPLTLDELKKEYSFTAPQSFMYLESNEKLKKYLEMVELDDWCKHHTSEEDED